MAYHFISVLGTGKYKAVRYRDGEKIGNLQKYIQLALMEKFHEELMEEDSRISILVTQDAKVKNWDKTENENPDASGKNLKEQLEEQFPELCSKVMPVMIESPSTEDSIWNVFNTIYDTFEEGDQIIFDITHSFRSIPMLAIAIINYAKVLKNCSLIGIYYGAYEAKETDPDLGEVAPITDLTLYNEILEWTNAANVFMKYGNASPMKEVLTEKKKRASIETRKEMKPIEEVVSAASALSDAIQTSRGIGYQNLAGKKQKHNYSIQAAVLNYKGKCEKMPEKELSSVRPLYKLLDKTQTAFEELDQDENYQTGIAVTKWCVKHGMIQQGYTALEETIITFLCQLNNLDQTQRDTREFVVNWSMNFLGQIISNADNQEKAMLDNESGRLHFFEGWMQESLDERLMEKLPKRTPEEMAESELKADVIGKMDPAYVKLMKKIKDYRNDINHFGMRPDPKKSEELSKKLGEFLREFEELERRV